MNVVSKKDRRAIHAVRLRERRLRKKLLRELSEAIENDRALDSLVREGFDPELTRITLSYGGFSTR